ncbi:MAG: hypothetical protein QM632_04880 [Micrococcaceae bacterium]
MTHMRTFKPMDAPGVYRLGIQTAMQGRIIEDSFNNQDLYGHVFVGPYIFHDPTHTVVAVDEYGINGYMAVSQHVGKMEAWAHRNWWPLLQDQYPERALNYTPFEQNLVHMIHHPVLTPRDIIENYPVKVDIRVGERLDHEDSIEQLLTTFMDQQWSRGVLGIHTDIPANDQQSKKIFVDAGFVEDQDISSHIRMVRSL